MYDILIIGGGCIGLSLAWELAERGQSVGVIDRGDFGQEASQAAAGIFPPARDESTLPVWDRLRGLSHQLHAQWSLRLKELTGIDNGFRLCGGVHLAQTVGEASALLATVSQMKADGIDVEKLSPQDLAELEPALCHQSAEFAAAYLLPDEACINGPRHLEALESACRQAGVEMIPETSAEQFQLQGDRVVGVMTSRGEMLADHFCLTAGAWSESLANQLGLNTSIYPVRGQMIRYNVDPTPVTRIINVGPRYVVPRNDGCLLVGSTEEDVGFDKRNTSEAIEELQRFAQQLLPSLANVPVTARWAGLRPQSIDGYPYLGRVGHLANASVAAGHYRSGLHLSTATAAAMAAVILGQPPLLDLSPFALNR